VKQIMAASILAKVTRDRIMQEYEPLFPGYWFEKHKGYGTKKHQQALITLGVIEIHRKSYAPIKLATSGKGL
jgi:ribonuclease HII